MTQPRPNDSLQPTTPITGSSLARLRRYNDEARNAVTLALQSLHATVPDLRDYQAITLHAARTYERDRKIYTARVLALEGVLEGLAADAEHFTRFDKP